MVAVPPHPGRTERETWESLLEYAVTAPSGHNTQPWRFRIVDDGLHLYADRRRALPVVDPQDRELVMSCGAALGQLEVAMRHFGHAGAITTFPDPSDPDLLAAAALGEEHTPRPSDHRLFEAIDRRHTHRADFEERAVDGTLLASLVRDAQRAGVSLHVIADDVTKAAVAALVGEGDVDQFDSVPFRRELASWLRPNRTRRHDGMPGYAFGVADLPSVLGPAVVASFNTGGRQALKDEQLARTSPVLAVLATEADTPSDWLAAGRALARLLLRAAAHGVAASFLNQPVEVPALRHRLRDLVGSEANPQLLMRLGHAAPDHPTPRRSVAEVLADDPDPSP